MQISLEWINELVDLQTISLNDLVNKLTLGGFEVEEILEIKVGNKKTTALDISATANRSDSLSIQGLSLEIASLLNQRTKYSMYSKTQYSWKSQVKNLFSSTLNEPDCLGFITLTIENIKDFNSPKWLQQKLYSSGITPQNNLIDFQNYIALETGYPLELYDLQKITSSVNTSDFTFSLANATKLSNFNASNNISYNLDNSILMLSANQLPISIAGIIPSKLTSCSTTTSSLIVEGSIFTATTIRQKSRFLGLRTDRSARYEKSLKDTNLFEALYRFVSLVRIANPNLTCKLHTFEHLDTILSQPITLYYNNIKQVLGPIQKTGNNHFKYISPEVITDMLKRLQFNIEFDPLHISWQVTVPPQRNNDISQEIDIIEEIGRIYGFNKFLTRLPNIKKIGLKDFDYQVRKKITSCLINMGLNELIQYSLNNKEIDLVNKIELVNPLVKDYSYLRSSLLPNLLDSIVENQRKSNKILEGFEYGHVFDKNSVMSFNEVEHVAGIFGGNEMRSYWSDTTRELTWFEAKGKIALLFQKLNVKIYWKPSKNLSEKQILHPYRTAEIFLENGAKVGIFGQLSSYQVKKFNVLPSLYLFELNFELIKSQSYTSRLTVCSEYTLYPSTIKDLSFIIKEDISFNNIKEILYLNGSKFLKEIHFKNEYRSKVIPEKHISLCLQLVFQSNFETLKNKKIDIIVSHLRKVLTNQFGAIIRD